MSIKLSELLVPRTTLVHRFFDTPEGEVEIKLNIRHKRITTAIQTELAKLATGELERMSQDIQKRQKLRNDLIEHADEKSRQEALKFLEKPYEAKNIVCLQLEYLLEDLDIVDLKNKPLKPTYANLITLPTELTEAIKEEIDNSTTPKKTTSTISSNGMPREGKEELRTIG